jgi:predicted TIM-barrel fold metal-dependent hydrolase
MLITPDVAAPTGWDAHVHVFDAAAPVLPGHYAPAHRPLAEIENLAAQHGFGHLVLVQPSVYGTDNQVLLKALAQSAGRHRGIVVVDAPPDDATLAAWHALGVRGIRCNLVSPVSAPPVDWAAWAPRLRELGWHVQWYAHAHQLQQVVDWQRLHCLPCVLDHVGGMSIRDVQDAVAWANLQRLSDAGAWIKLSGWYRLGLSAPYDLQALEARRVMHLFESRCVWGSDWPHTSFAHGLAPKYESLWRPLQKLLGEPGVSKLAQSAQQLYA